MHENEEWRDIAGYEGLYKVSNLGRVMRVKGSPGARSDRVLKPVRDRNGYLHVGLSRRGKQATRYVHRLVAFAFLTGEAKREVDHIDGNKTNNNAENLRWATPSENVNNPVTIKLRARPVVCVDTGKIFESLSAAGDHLRVSCAAICYATRGVHKTAGGFHWRYAKPEEIEKLPG